MTQCSAKSKQSGQRCKNTAVAGGKVCHIHGGKTPRAEASPHYVTGRYSRFMKQSLQEKMQAVDDENPLDLLPELQVQRALFAEYISRFQPGVPLGIGDIDYLMEWSGSIGKTVERIVKLRLDTALTMAEIALIAARIPEVVVRFIDDPNKQRAFIEALFSSVGSTEAESPRQLSETAATR